VKGLCLVDPDDAESDTDQYDDEEDTNKKGADCHIGIFSSLLGV
jgi:hypothetical protein